MPENQSQIYRDLMRFRPDGLTPNAWAVKAGVSRTVWADMRRHGNPSRRTLEKLLAAAGSSLAEFEALRLGTAPATISPGISFAEPGRQWTAASSPPLPLLASSLAGEFGAPGSGIELTAVDPARLLDRLPRPPSLASDRDAYALTIVGDSMWPRFRPGRRVAVSPLSAASVGDDVVIRLRSKGAGGEQLVLVNELVKRTGSQIELRQFNPALTFIVEAAEVESIHKVAGELI